MELLRRPATAPALIAAATLLLHAPSPAPAAEIKVISGGAPKDALAVLIPKFESLTGHRVRMTYRVITALKQSVSGGETPDMVVAPDTAIAELARDRKLKQGGSAPFGIVKLVAIVKEGRTPPDLSTTDAFRDTLLTARSIVYSPPTATPSGAHLARVVARLQIAEAIKAKVTYRPALDGGAQMVANDKAEIGIYPRSEVVQVKGIVQTGPIPASLQLALAYGGAVLAANPDPAPALAFIRFLADDDNKAVWREAGFDPP